MKRPLVLICVLLTAVVAVCYGLFPENADLFGKNENLNRYAGSVICVQGTVKSYEKKDGYAVLLIKHAVFFAREKGSTVPYSLHTVRATLDEGGMWEEDGKAVCRVGETVLIRGKLTPSAKASNPGQFNEAQYDRLHHISCRMKGAVLLSGNGKYSKSGEAAASFGRFLFRRLRNVYPDDTEDVLAAMLLGKKEALSYETSRKYESGGISHMLVISSMHLSILGGAVYGLLRKCRCSVPGSALSGGIILLFFVFMTGCSLSAVRAAVIYLTAMTAKLTGRTYDRRNAAAFAAILLLLSDPYYLFYSSFQLSFAAAILCILSENKGKTAGCVIIQFGMMPLIAWHFFEIPVLGIPVNLLLLPLLPVILVTGAVGLLLGGYSVLPAVVCVRLYDRILRVITHAPESVRIFGRWEIPLRTVFITGRPKIRIILCYYILFSLFLYLLYCFRNKRKKLAVYLLLPLLIFVLRIHNPETMAVTFLDVGQGDCIVAESPEGLSMLVDGGSSDVRNVGKYRILPYIKYRGIQKMDIIAVTHADSDHMSGILEILNLIARRETALRADYLLLPDVMEILSSEEEYTALEKAACDAGMRVIRVRKGDSFTLGKAEVRILGPAVKEKQKEADANAHSIVMQVSCGGLDVLLTGDVCGEGEEELIRTIRDADQQYEILKVAHHGSRYSTPEDFLEIVNPDVSVISSGAENLYGHPHAETLERLEKCGTIIYRTEECGAVTVRTDGSHYTVDTYLD